MRKTVYKNQIMALLSALRDLQSKDISNIDVQESISNSLNSYSRLVDSVEERELEEWLLNYSCALHPEIIDDESKTPELYKKCLDKVIFELEQII